LAERDEQLIPAAASGCRGSEGPQRSRDDSLIDRLQEIRSRSNVLWMQIVRIAMREAPEEARGIFREIEANDRAQLDAIRETYGEDG
jgi:hypothetical protein